MPISINGSTGISGVNGSAGTPALQGGDADTGIFFGTDTASIATAGSQRLIVTSAGNIGIANASPGYALDVGSAVIQVGTSTDAFTQYKSTAGNWHTGANAGNAYVIYSGTYGSGSEQFRIEDDGKVGINTGVNPKTRLEIKGTDGNFITLSHATRPGSFRIEHSGTQSENLAFIHDEGDPVVSTSVLTMGKGIWYTYHDGTNDFIKDGGLFYGVANGNAFLSKPYYTNTISGSSVTAGLFINLIPNNVLNSGNVYLVKVTLTNSGNPYHHTAVVSMSPSSNNNPSPNSTLTTGGVQHSHVGGGYTMTFRDTAGNGHVISGLDMKLSYNLTSTMNIYVSAYRLGH